MSVTRLLHNRIMTPNKQEYLSLRVSGEYFHFCCVLQRNSCEQTVWTLKWVLEIQTGRGKRDNLGIIFPYYSFKTCYDPSLELLTATVLMTPHLH